SAIGVQLRQNSNLKLVDLNSIFICAVVEVKRDYLNNYLLRQVHCSSHEYRQQHKVHLSLPVSQARVPVNVVVSHYRLEGDKHGHPPEKQGNGKLEPERYVFPCFIVHGEDA